MRPNFVDASDPLQYAAIFTEFDKQAALGRYPISVQGGGGGTGIRYAAVFAGRNQPIARAWSQLDAVGADHSNVHSVAGQTRDAWIDDVTGPPASRF
jgi:hypothetical protein